MLRFCTALIVVGAHTSSSFADLKDELELPARVKEIFRTRCLECHGGTKTLAKLKILDHSALLKNEHIVPHKPDDSEIFKRIIAKDNEGRMPDQPLPALDAAEIDTVRRWIVTGAKTFPPDVKTPLEANKDDAFRNLRGIDYVLKQILSNVQTLDAIQLPHIRYFSINHLLTGGATREKIDLYRDALAKAINHLSSKEQIAPLIVVDPPTASVFAVDLRKLGWNKTPFQRWEGKAMGASLVNLWDLVLLEYPYGITYPDSETFRRLEKEYIRHAGLLRPIPFIRADWFIATATQSPLYEDLLGLPQTVEVLEKMLGVGDVERNLRDGSAFRAGMIISGVSRNNRVVERHASTHGAYWKSFDFRTSKGAENMFIDPIHLNPAGGEFIFNLPNGLQGYFVANNQGKKVEFAPTEIVTDKFAADQTVRNGLACMRCHDSGMKPFADTVRPVLLKLQGTPGFDKRFALQLYAPQDKWDGLLKQDREKFLKLIYTVLGHEQKVEPLIPTSKEYLDFPIGLSLATGELGLTDPAEIKTMFKLPQFTAIGLSSLADDGMVRRDTWEDYYTSVVQTLGLGEPLIPLDGLTRNNILTDKTAALIELSTNRKGNVFAPGDKAIISVKNKSDRDLFIEIIGTGANEKSLVLVPAGLKIKAGETYHYPPEGSTITVRGGVGRDRITIFASTNKFAPGVLLRGENIADRFVHLMYDARATGLGLQNQSYCKEIIKKTLDLETK